MTLPIRTTIEDIEKICGYLATKPTGARLAEAKAVLDTKVLDGRKLTAFRKWGLIEEGNEKLKLTERGRQVARDKGVNKAAQLVESVREIDPYRAAIEKAFHKQEFVLTATDLAAYWYEHFAEDVSDNDRILNDQALCFFQLAQGADLGSLVVGRKGQPTRLEIDPENAARFVDGGGPRHVEAKFENDLETDFEDVASASENDVAEVSEIQPPEKVNRSGNRVFITHGKNGKILEQVKELVAYGKFEPVIAKERETAAKSVPDKVMDDMRACQAAVIHVGADEILFDNEGNEKPQINGNVLIEVGAALALYGKNFILLVEEGVSLPSNLQGLYECRYSGDELNMPATMKLLKAFNDFR